MAFRSKITVSLMPGPLRTFVAKTAAGSGSIVVDNFNRSGDLAGSTTSDGNETWTEQRDGFRTSGTQAQTGQSGDGNRGECHITSSRSTAVADIEAEIDYVSGGGAGVVIRASTAGTSNSTTHIRAIRTNALVKLVRKWAGADDADLVSSGAYSGAGTVGVKAVGTMLYLYADGNLVGSYDQDGDAHKIDDGAYGIYSDFNAVQTVDDFEATNSDAAAAGGAFTEHYYRRLLAGAGAI